MDEGFVIFLKVHDSAELNELNGIYITNKMYTMQIYFQMKDMLN